MALIAAFGSAGWAQQTTPVAPQAQAQEKSTQAAATQAPSTLRELFANADRNGDGKVTRDEAKGHLPITFANFDQIDKDKRGWISFDQFMAFTNQRVQKQADDIVRMGDQY